MSGKALRDVIIEGRRITIGVTQEFSESEIATLQNIADAGGTTIQRVVRSLAARGVEARGDEEGGLDLLFEWAGAEGPWLAQFLLEAIFPEFCECDFAESESLEDFLKEVVRGLNDDESIVSAEDRALLLSVAKECHAGRGKAARRTARPLIDRGWETEDWDVGFDGWRNG